MNILRRLDLTGEHEFDDEPAVGTGALSGFQTRGLGQSGGDDAQREKGDGTRFYGQLGLAVRPLIAAGLEMLSLFDEQADEHVGIALLQRKLSHAVAIASGETRVYAAGAPKACLRLLGGFIEIRIGEGDGAELRLAPDAGVAFANKSVARVDDTVNRNADFAAWATSVSGALATLTMNPSFPVAPVTIGAIATGAAKVKA